MSKSLSPVMVVASGPAELADAVTELVRNNHDLYTQPFVTNDGQLCQYLVPSACLYEYALIHASELVEFNDQVQMLSALGYDFMFSTLLWNGDYVQWMGRMTEIGNSVRDVMSTVADAKFKIVESAAPVVKIDINERAQLFANQLRAWNKELQDGTD